MTDRRSLVTDAPPAMLGIAWWQRRRIDGCRGKPIPPNRVPGRKLGPEQFDEVGRVWHPVDKDCRKMMLFLQHYPLTPNQCERISCCRFNSF